MHFRELSVSKNIVFDTLGGCLKGCRGKEGIDVGERTARRASFLFVRSHAVDPWGQGPGNGEKMREQSHF